MDMPHKMLGISWLVEDPLASKEGLCSMAFFRYRMCCGYSTRSFDWKSQMRSLDSNSCLRGPELTSQPKDRPSWWTYFMAFLSFCRHVPGLYFKQCHNCFLARHFRFIIYYSSRTSKVWSRGDHRGGFRSRTVGGNLGKIQN